MPVVIAWLIAFALFAGARAEDAPARVPEPWLGIWKLRVPAGAPAGSEVVRFEPLDGGYRTIHDSVGPDGKVAHYEYFARPDGQDYPIRAGSSMAVRVIKVDDHTMDWWTLKGGAVVLSGRSVHSRDGKTKTMTFSRTNEKGEKVEVAKVYDRVPAEAPSAGRDVPATARDDGIASVTEGTGPPLLVIHGAMGDLRSFSGAIPILSERSTVTRVSLRLHWPNPWPVTEKEAYDDYLIEKHAADVVKAIEKSGRAPVDLLGHSYGGTIAFVVARTRPELVRRLILVEPSLQRILEGDPEGERLLAGARAARDSRLAKLRGGATPLELVRGMYDEARPGTFDSFPERRRRILTDNARTMGPGLVHNWIDFPVTCEDARTLRMPVLVVEGGRTTALAHAIARALLPCLADARHVVLPDATHTIQFDAPEAMARVVADYLAR